MHRQLGASRFAIIVAHRRFGKTVLAVNESLDRALHDKSGDGRYGYLAPYLKQSKEIAWDYYKRYSAHLPTAKVNESELTITFGFNGARIRLYGADNAEAMRGGYFDHLVVDEPADIKPNVWGEIIRPALADRKGGALFIGTTKGINLLSELYHNPPPGWFKALYRADETGIIPADELELARATMSEAAYRQEFLCDWSAASDNILITIDVVSAAAGKVLAPGAIEGSPKILGVDVARYGDDRSCIMRRQGLCAYDPLVRQGLDNMELASLVAEQITLFQPDAVFVDGGRGEGVIDRLRQLGHHVIEIQFGGKPIDPRFVNKRSEMWYSMAEWLKNGGHIPNDAQLKTELAAPTYTMANAAGRIEIEPKEKLKERGMRSPDIADALALTFAMPVAAKSLMLGGSKAREVDPFAGV